MEIIISVNIAPFSVPDGVKVIGERSSGIHGTDNQTINLSQIDEFTLERLCLDFTNDVFKKAGKSRPPQCGGKS